MKVAFVIDRWDPSRGGAEQALALLATHLAARGHEAHVYAIKGVTGAPGTLHKCKRPLRPRGAMEAAFARDAVHAARADGCHVVVGVRHMEETDIYWPHGGLHAATLAANRAVAREIARIGNPPVSSAIMHRVGCRVAVRSTMRSARHGATSAPPPRLTGSTAGANLHVVEGEHASRFFVHWLDVAAPVAIGGLWVWMFTTQLMQRPMLAFRDPYLQEALQGSGGH